MCTASALHVWSKVITLVFWKKVYWILICKKKKLRKILAVDKTIDMY